MAFELGAIIARVKADTSNFRQGMGEVRDGLGAVGSGMQRTVGYSQAVVGGIAAVGAVLGAAGGFAIKSAAGIESTHAAFTTMLGDGEKAGALMRELNTFAAETPFEFPELADAGKKLLAFGFAANEIQPNLRRLGDVASGLGIPIGELSELYGKAKVQGRLYMEDVNQLTGRGIPIIQEFAKQFGVSQGEVRGLIESGKIGFPELQKGIENMTNAGGQFAGGMAAQSKTVNGLMSTLQDNIGAFARKLVGIENDGAIKQGGVFYYVKEGLVGVISFLEKNQDRIINGVGGIVKFIKDNFPVVAGIITALVVPALISFAAAGVSAAAGFIAAMWPLIAIGAAIGLAMQYFNIDLGDVVNFIRGNVVPVVQSFIGWLMQVGQAALPILKAALDFLMPSLTALWNAIVTQLWPALQNIFNTLVQFWNFISPVLIPILTVLAAILGGLIVGAIWLVVNAIRIVIDIFSFLSNVAMAVVYAIMGYFTLWWAYVQAVFNAFVGFVAMILDVIKNYFVGWFNFVKAIFQTIINVASALFRGDLPGAFQAAINGIKNIFGSLGAWFSGVWNSIIGGLSNIGEGIVRPFREAIGKIKDLVNGAKDVLNKLNPFSRNSPSLVDWIKKGTGVIVDQYDRMSNAIAAGTTAARIQTLGTARSLENVSASELAARDGGNGGGGRGSITINVEGVLADSPEAKRKFGAELVNLINDERNAKGAATL